MVTNKNHNYNASMNLGEQPDVWDPIANEKQLPKKSVD